MATCKFCGIPEGAPDRRGKHAHINRDNLCAPCYYVLERIKYQPEVLTDEEHAWFVDMCDFNFKHNMFVPVAQRRELRAKAKTRCRVCGRELSNNPGDPVTRDKSYTLCCVACAEELRTVKNRPIK